MNRSFFPAAFAFILALLAHSELVAGAEKLEQKSPNDSRFRFEVVDAASLLLRQGDRPVFAYNYGEIASATSPNVPKHSAYLHPVYGLDGEVLTDDFPKDHVYHRGLYWAWSHITVAGQEYDTWSLRGLRYQFQRWLKQETKTNVAILGVENGWFIGDKQIMRESVIIETHLSSAESRSIDIALTWTPTDAPVTLSGAPGKSYGGLTFRFGPRTETIITVPSGRAREDLLMTKLPWADFSADFNKKPGEFSGAAIFVDPNHPDFPPTWMTRDYGMLAVGWPGVTPQTFPRGKSFTCRYRIWVHRGAPPVSEIENAYRNYRMGLKPGG
jgi:hypothetical protein